MSLCRTRVSRALKAVGGVWLVSALSPIGFSELPYGDAPARATGRPAAPVKVHRLFSDNMVLQRESAIPVWGTGTPGWTLSVALGNNRLTTKIRPDGRWRVSLPPLRAGGPFQLRVSGRDTVTFNNVLIGEVWLCSGQSNMAMPVAGWGNVLNYEQEVAGAVYPGIRFFTVPNVQSRTPQDTLTASAWQVCSPFSVGQFSAVAYFFGRHLHRKLNVPVGLINSSWGGTPVEAWTSGDSIRTVSTPLRKFPPRPLSPDDPGNPSTLYNGMIAPLIPYAMRGVIWYQGESNAPRAAQYRTLFPLLIRDWRARWGQGDFPFLFVQLANYTAVLPEPGESDWAELREAQRRALSLKNTGMAVAIDLGEADDIHPRNKQAVGDRLALIARAITYHEAIPYSGPMYRDMAIEGSRVRLRFDHAGSGLATMDGGPLKGFAVAGEDRTFHRADASIEGNTILVQSPHVAAPVAVRYAWAANPVNNLCNRENLPASPFRTDTWPGITEEVR